MPSAVEGWLSSGCYHAGDRDRMLLGCCSQRGTVDAFVCILMSQCRHALRQDIWQVMSLDGLWTQYTQADGYSHEGYAHRLKEREGFVTTGAQLRYLVLRDFVLRDFCI